MLDYGRVIATIYDLADNPTEAELPFHRVIRLVELVDVQLCSELDDTNQLWRLKSGPVPIDPGQGDVLVTLPDFGRAVIAEIEAPSTYAYGTTRRRIYISDLTDQDRYQSPTSPYFTGLVPGAGWAAEEIGFFHKDGQIWARITPAPAYSYAVTVHYEPGPPIDRGERDLPGSIEAAAVAAFPLLAHLVAKKVVAGKTPWLDAQTKQMKYAEIREEIVRCRQTWDSYRMQDHQADNSGVIEGFSLGRRVPYLG